MKINHIVIVKKLQYFKRIIIKNIKLINLCEVNYLRKYIDNKNYYLNNIFIINFLNKNLFFAIIIRIKII